MTFRRREFLGLLAGVSLAGCAIEPPRRDSVSRISPSPIQSERYAAITQANRIRELAGIPDGVEYGVQSAVSAGLSDSGALSAASRISITSESEAQSASSAGSGTESDPYIIENKRLDNSEASGSDAGINVSDFDGQYWIKIQNCEINGYNDEQIFAAIGESGGGGVIIENCKIYAASGRFLVNNVRGNIRIRQTLFAGLPNGDRAIQYNDNTSWPDLDFVVENCRFDESQELFSSTSLIGNASTRFGGRTLEVRHSEFDVANAGLMIDLLGDYVPVIENCHVVSWPDSPLIQTSCGDGARIRRCRFEDGGGGAADNGYITFDQSAVDTSDVLVEHCEFSGINNRHVMLTPADDSEIAWCKSTQTIGDGSAGWESFESRAATRVDIHHCWVTEHTEDSFEHVKSLDCSIHHCVGDNIAGQVADIHHGKTGSGTDSGSEVHHIYGDAGGEGVQVNGANDVTVSHVYVDAPTGVNIVAGSPAADGIAVYGPLPLAENVDSIVDIPDSATNCYAVYRQGNQVVTKDSGEGVPAQVITELR